MATGNANPILNHRGSLFAVCMSGDFTTSLTLLWRLRTGYWGLGTG